MDVYELRKRLEEYGQEHLLRFWDELDEKHRAVLFEELSSLKLDGVSRCFARATASMGNGKEFLDDKIEPIPSDSIESPMNSNEDDVARYMDMGLKEIADGKVAVLLMAGGQGSRLGVDYPKGMYDVGLPSGSTLFRLQAEKILKLQRLAEEKFEECGKIQL